MGMTLKFTSTATFLFETYNILSLNKMDQRIIISIYNGLHMLWHIRLFNANLPLTEEKRIRKISKRIKIIYFK
jgi:hypothetical protein